MKIKLSDIKTPETIEEFRENLQKYFMTTGGGKGLMIMGEDDVSIDELESLSHLYRKEIMKPSISPQVIFDNKEVTYYNFNEYWDKNESEIEVCDDSREFIQEMEKKNLSPSWYGIDNQILRGFYMKVLGSYSGYCLSV